MKKFMKFILILFITILLLTSVVFAEDPPNIYNNLTPDTGASAIASKIISVIMSIAVVVAVISTIVLGIRYMYSAPSDKAEIKQKMLPYIIGSILIFASTGLVNLVYIIAKGF